MIPVTVKAAMGATLRGPLKVKLSPAQHALRAHVLGPVNKKGIYDLDGHQHIVLKYGETLQIDQVAGRLNHDLFDVPVEKAAAVKADGETIKSGNVIIAPVIQIPPETDGSAGDEGGEDDDQGETP